MSGIAGLRGTGDWGIDERPKNFREGILRFNPNGTAPIFELTSKEKSRSVHDPEFALCCEGTVLIRRQANGVHASTDTLINVDPREPTSTTMSANFGTATH